MHGEHLSLQTPEQVELHLELAGIGSRFVAALIDTLLQSALVVGGGLALGVGRWLATGDFSRLGTNLAIVAGSVVLVVVAYHTAFELLWAGQSPGKRLAGIAVVRDDGAPIGASEALVRNLLRIVDILPALYAIGLAAIFISRTAKRVGDAAAGTVVVRTPRGDEEALMAALRPEEAPPGAAAVPAALRVSASRLTADEAATVLRFLQRRHELGAESRAELARRLATALRPRFPAIGPDEAADPEEFLEAVGRGLE